MSELPTARSMRALFSQIALLREYQEADDPRCAEAARNLHLLAATTSEVPADVLLRLSEACERVSPATVAQLTLEIVIGIGLERGLFASATEFYETLIASVAGDQVAPSPRLN
jgi:hypothetical protein